MTGTMEKDFESYFNAFSENHDRLKDQLMSSLTGVQTQWDETAAVKIMRPRPVGFKVALALAASVMIALGVLFVFNSNQGMVSTQAVWADALEQASRVQSLQFKMETASSKNDSWVNVWWRRPNDFRLEFSTGLIITGNDKVRCKLSKNELEITEAAGMGVEVFVLNQVGQLFGNEDDRFRRAWIKNNKVVSSEQVIYKGEKCRKVVSEFNQRRFEYIIDARAKDNRMPFYEVKEYSDLQGSSVLSHIEVLAVDEEMSARLFEIKPQPGQKVIDRRN